MQWRTGRGGLGIFHLRVGAVLTEHGRGWGVFFNSRVGSAYRICVALWCGVVCFVRVVLCCVVLCCVVLCCVVLCCVVLCCVVKPPQQHTTQKNFPIGCRGLCLAKMYEYEGEMMPQIRLQFNLVTTNDSSFLAHD